MRTLKNKHEREKGGKRRQKINPIKSAAVLYSWFSHWGLSIVRSSGSNTVQFDEKVKEETIDKQAPRVSCLAYCSILSMEAISFSEIISAS
jgi:hypothetical protein